MSDKKLPGGPSGHVDSFARDHLPPKAEWAEMDYASLPELAAYPDRMNAAVELLDSHVAAGRGERTAILFGDLQWSYAELKDRADRIARVLVEDMGLVSGNRVLLRGPNNPMMAASWLGIVKAGGVCVATMPLLRARELAFMVEKAEIRHALCDAALADELKGCQERAPRLETCLYFSATGEEEAEVDRLIRDKQAGFDNCDTAADDVALIAFTSGTTGQPKGTMHFHRDVLAMSDCFPKYIFDARPDDICTGSPPLAFTFGLGALLTFPLRHGAAIAYFAGPPAPETLLETIGRHGCTALYTAPTMYRAMLDVVDAHDISTLEKCVSAGEHLPKPTWEAWHDTTGIKIIDGLGSTEMIHIFVSASGDDIRPGATGRAIPGYEACVVDDDGRPLPPGEAGNLAVRGPTGCRYLDNPERQAAYVKNDWNLPGDVYAMDEDGYFWYQARADDMIISAGYNISGPEVESVLLDHDKVQDCAVVAAPHPERGHIVKAFVVLRDPADANDGTVKTLQDFVKNEIAPYKYPRAVEFVDDLPRTETGKVQRFKLRQQEEAKAGAS
ncbi:MAG: benzoate-CoA ligase family protein [Alphaproteobacteria bacterium]|nr:benzoate-CoA ligase family protein [Alphaproteobacteria bacterium]